MSVALAFDSFGAGPPVLILHGLFGSRHNWRRVATSLASTHRVLTVDLRNHGTSPWADSMSYADMAADVHALILSEGLHSPTVIGHSMGGKTAMALALTNPGSVGQLIVVDIAPVSYGDRHSAYVRAMRMIDTKTVTDRAEVQRKLAQQIADQGLVAFLMQNLVSQRDRYDWRLNLPVIGACLEGLGGFPPELRKRRFERPASLIVGSRSDYVGPEDVKAFRALFPRLEMAVVEDADHWVHADRPEAFLASVRRFVGAQA